MRNELSELYERNPELIAKKLLDMLCGHQAELEQDLAQVTIGARALKLERALELVLSDEPEPHKPNAQLER